ncbi:hypothetical protein A3Q56_05887, partial [Intoshia linei]
SENRKDTCKLTDKFSEYIDKKSQDIINSKNNRFSTLGGVFVQIIKKLTNNQICQLMYSIKNKLGQLNVAELAVQDKCHDDLISLIYMIEILLVDESLFYAKVLYMFKSQNTFSIMKIIDSLNNIQIMSLKRRFKNAYNQSLEDNLFEKLDGQISPIIVSMIYYKQSSNHESRQTNSKLADTRGDKYNISSAWINKVTYDEPKNNYTMSGHTVIASIERKRIDRAVGRFKYLLENVNKAACENELLTTMSYLANSNCLQIHKIILLFKTKFEDLFKIPIINKIKECLQYPFSIALNTFFQCPTILALQIVRENINTETSKLADILLIINTILNDDEIVELNNQLKIENLILSTALNVTSQNKKSCESIIAGMFNKKKNMNKNIWFSDLKQLTKINLNDAYNIYVVLINLMNKRNKYILRKIFNEYSKISGISVESLFNDYNSKQSEKTGYQNIVNSITKPIHFLTRQVQQLLNQEHIKYNLILFIVMSKRKEMCGKPMFI